MGESNMKPPVSPPRRVSRPQRQSAKTVVESLMSTAGDAVWSILSESEMEDADADGGVHSDMAANAIKSAVEYLTRGVVSMLADDEINPSAADQTGRPAEKPSAGKKSAAKGKDTAAWWPSVADVLVAAPETDASDTETSDVERVAMDIAGKVWSSFSSIFVQDEAPTADASQPVARTAATTVVDEITAADDNTDNVQQAGSDDQWTDAAYSQTAHGSAASATCNPARAIQNPRFTGGLAGWSVALQAGSRASISVHTPPATWTAETSSHALISSTGPGSLVLYQHVPSIHANDVLVVTWRLVAHASGASAWPQGSVFGVGSGSGDQPCHGVRVDMLDSRVLENGGQWFEQPSNRYVMAPVVRPDALDAAAVGVMQTTRVPLAKVAAARGKVGRNAAAAAARGDDGGVVAVRFASSQANLAIEIHGVVVTNSECAGQGNTRGEIGGLPVSSLDKVVKTVTGAPCGARCRKPYV
ncbi:hypothetical protein BC831DRAFT_454752 [Entophlyctis helioformis]|nr:hypothetical protein BC831DRAFT_454752 [Entophlyctis helioformis]